jgi:hypothetical protein
MTTLRGTVRRGGKPVAARVELRPVEPLDVAALGPGPWEMLQVDLLDVWVVSGPALRTVDAGDDGRFALSEVPPGVHELRAIDGEGRMRLLRTRVEGGANPEDREVEVPDGGPLRVRARYSSGRPFDGEVRLVTTMSGPRSARTCHPVFPDGSGLFVGTKPRQANRSEVQARTPGGLLVIVPILPPTGEEPIELVVDDDLEILSGRVVRADDDRPVERARVLVGPSTPRVGGRIRRSASRPGQASWCALARTDAEGRFAVGVPPGEVSLAVRADGHAPVDRVVDREAMPVEVRVPRTGALRGVVRAEGGAPVPDILVHASCERRVARARTDDAGGYELHDLSPGLAHVVAHGRGWTSVSLDPEVRRIPGEVKIEPGSTTEQDILVVPAGSLTGRVLDSDGKGAAGVGLCAYPVRRPLRIGGGGPDPSSYRPGKGVSGPDGRFRVEDLVPGISYGLVTESSEVASAQVGPVTPRSGKDVVVDLRLPPRRMLDVRVLGEAGEPVEGALVRVGEKLEKFEAFGWSPCKSDVATDGRGRARVGPLPEGDLAIAVEAPGRVVSDGIPLERLETDEQGCVVFRLGPSFEISGRILDAAGEPLRGGSVRVNRVARGQVLPGLEERLLALDAAGRFRLTGLDDGRWEITLSTSHRPSMHGRWVLRSGVRDVDLRVRRSRWREPGAKMTARIVDEVWRPVLSFRAGVTFRVGRGPGGGHERCRETRGPVEHVFVDPRARAWVTVLDARDADGRRLAATVAGPYEAADQKVEIRLPLDQRVSGRVRGPGGEPVVGGTVEACAASPGDCGMYGYGEPHGSTGTDGEGRFVLVGLGDGPYVLRVSSPDGLAQRTFPHVTGGVTKQTVEMVEAVTVALRLLDDQGLPLSRGDASVARLLPRGERVSIRAGHGIADEEGRVRLTDLDPDGAYELSTGGFAADGGDLSPGGREAWKPCDETIRHVRHDRSG